MKTIRLVEKQSLHEYATQETMNARSATNNALSNESPSASASTPSLPQRSAIESPCARRRRHALKLRVVHHKYAAQIAAHARAVELYARKLVRLHARIKAEAVGRL